MYQPDFFHYTHGVKTVAGMNALDELPQLMELLGVRKPLVITDTGVVKAGLLDILRSRIASESADDSLVIASQVPPDSDVTVVSEIGSLFRSSQCDGIIALGGGSVIDTAKGVNILVSNDGNDLTAFSGAGKLKRPLEPLIVIPTTSGTGSEATQAAVIRDPKSKRKLLFTSEYILPDAAVLDPRMTLSLPLSMTAYTAMDALSHAVEAYTGLAKNPLSDTSALRAIELISKNLPAALKDPESTEARLQLAIASNLAGTAFSNSMVGIVHTIGHSVGAVCGVPHGICMSILLPYGMAYNSHKTEKWLQELLLPLAGPANYHNTREEDRAEAAITAVNKLNRKLNTLSEGKHPLRFRDVYTREGKLAVRPEHLPVIAMEASGDGSQFYNQEEITEEDILFVLHAAYWGYPLDRKRIQKGHQR
ncbi:MAG: iron-containing alcohol dehydrogenase [Spirochaetia bacterium]|nr:iron-containing alcohol dehydrogenase [Spirochaetia bacterium]